MSVAKLLGRKSRIPVARPGLYCPSCTAGLRCIMALIRRIDVAAAPTPGRGQAAVLASRARAQLIQTPPTLTAAMNASLAGQDCSDQGEGGG